MDKASEKVKGKSQKVEPEEKDAKLTPLDKYEILVELIKKQPGLADKLLEALETDRYFITVTFQKKYKPTDQHDLHHYFCRRQFMKNDVVPALKHLANDFMAKEMPNAEIKSDEWV